MGKVLTENISQIAYGGNYKEVKLEIRQNHENIPDKRKSKLKIKANAVYHNHCIPNQG